MDLLSSQPTEFFDAQERLPDEVKMITTKLIYLLLQVLLQ